QAASLLRGATSARYPALYRLALDSGARRGELLALTWADLELGAAPEAVFSKSLQEVSGEARVNTTKTPKGRGRARLPPATAEALLAHRDASRRQAPEDLVFQKARGGPVWKAKLERDDWYPLRRRAGVEWCRFHDLRHTCATLLLVANVHPKV